MDRSGLQDLAPVHQADVRQDAEAVTSDPSRGSGELLTPGPGAVGVRGDR
jgi:hypothetical protein